MDDMALILEETYKYLVQCRNKEYDREKTLDYIRRAAKWISGDYKPGLLLYGTIGSGKSTLMESIVKCMTITAPELKKCRKSAIEISNEAKNNFEAFEMIKKSEILFIDDLGEEEKEVKNFGNNISPMVELLYYRYDKQLFTVITTNLIDGEIEKAYGPRIDDRFAEMFDRIYFDIDSFRRKS